MATASDPAGRVRLVRRPALRAATADAAARAHLRALAQAGAAAADAGLVLAGVHDTGRGPLVVRCREEVDGLPVSGAASRS